MGFLAFGRRAESMARPTRLFSGILACVSTDDELARTRKQHI